jgi:hypothetical protein
MSFFGKDREMNNRCDNKRTRRIALMLAAGSLAIASQMLKADPPAGDPPPPPATRPAEQADTLSGTVDALNLNAGGMPNAIILKDSSSHIMQVNFPPFASMAVSAAVAVGDQVTLTAVPRKSMPDHPLYELVTLSGAKDQHVTVPRPGDDQTVHVDGVVKRLNYGHEGEVDGAVLESGEFVHVGPREAEQLNLAVGRKLAVDGHARPAMTNVKVIDATSVNGVEIKRPRPERGGPGEPGGPGGPDGGMRHGPDRDGPRDGGQDGPPPPGR